MINAKIKKNIPLGKIDNVPKSLTKKPPIAIPIAIPPLILLKNIPFASSGVSGSTELSIYCMRLYPTPSRIPNIKIRMIVGIKNIQNS